MTRTMRIVTAAMAALALGGCATVTSKYAGSGEAIRSRIDNLPTCPPGGGMGADTCRPRVAEAEAGVTYFLPRQLVRVTATRTGGKLDDAVKALVKAQSDLEDAKAEQAATELLITQTENQLIDPKATDDGKAILKVRLAEQKAQLDKDQKAVDEKTAAVETAKAEIKAAAAAVKKQSDHEAAQAAVAADEAAIKGIEDQIIALSTNEEAKQILRGRISVLNVKLEADRKAAAAPTIGSTPRGGRGAAAAPATDKSDEGPGAYKVALKIELLSPSPDPEQAFRLSPRHTPLRDDDHKLTVSPVGLLTSTDITAADRTGDILIELAAFAGAIKGGALGGVARDGRGETEPKDCKNSPSEFTGIVDFVVPGSVARLNDDLQCLGVRLMPSGKFWPAYTRPSPTPNSFYPGAVGGIAYRTPIDVEVRVEKCVRTDGACEPTDKAWLPAEVLALSLPQAGPISYVRQDSGFLTKTKYTLAFKDGVLTDYTGSRPSELLEGARLPMKILQSTFDGISKVISLRTGQNNDRAALLTSQLALLNAQTALKTGALKGEQGVADAQLALLQSQIALQAGTIEGKTKLSAADLALLQQQYALQIAPLEGQRALSAAQVAVLQQQFAAQLAAINGGKDTSAAQLAALQQQFALQAGTAAGQTQISNADLAQLQAQTALALARNTANTQLSASDLAVTAALLRDQARRDAMNRCVTEKVQAGQTIDGCLTGL